MQKKQGISLIVLVITIIVMIILAAAIILSLNNAGIIGNANKAVDETNIANIKAAADLAYAEYLIAPVEIEAGKDLGDYLTDKLVAKGTIKGRNEDYYIEMYDKEAVVIKVGTVADMYYKEQIKKADYIDYETTGYTGKWQVMGITKNGELLILSEDNVVEDFALGERANYSSVVQTMNNKCAEYGKGYGAVGARSITLEDVNKITGYKVEEHEYHKGKISEYGISVTFYWDGTNKPYYKTSNGKEGNLRKDHSEFVWYDQINGWQTSTKSTTATAEKMEKICTLTTNNIDYWVDRYIDTSSSEFNMLAGFYIMGEFVLGRSYWLAGQTSYLYERHVSTSIYILEDNKVFSPIGFYSDNTQDNPSSGLRAVVTLDKNISITGNSTDGWTIVK